MTTEINTKGRVRFSKADWFTKIYNRDVLVIGAGGIGSWLINFLARLGANVIVYDGDPYNVNNLGGQLIGKEAVGTNKAEAIADLVNGFIGEQRVTAIDDFYTAENSTTYPDTFACVDNMEVRLFIYQQWLSQKKDRNIFIDGRMGAEQYQLYCITKEQDHYLKKHWFPSNEATPLPCAYRATSHIGSMVASQMIASYTNFYSENYVPERSEFITQIMKMETS